MRGRALTALIAGVTAWSIAARAQQPAMPVVGALETGAPAYHSPSAAAFLRGLSQAGYAEGQNVTIEVRWAENRYERIPALAQDLIRRRVSVIFAGNVVSALATKAETSVIPIVFITGVDPVELGLVASLSRPGGNLTGISMLGAGLVAKRLELLHEVVPKASTIGAVVNRGNPNAELQLRNLEVAARGVGMQLHPVQVSSVDEFEASFAMLSREQAQAVVVGADPMFFQNRDRLVALAARHRLPAVYEWREFTETGGLMSYGPSLLEARRQAGVYVGRILKGEKPEDLPVLQPTQFELVVNLRTARSLGLDVPPSLLARADEVIE